MENIIRELLKFKEATMLLKQENEYLKQRLEFLERLSLVNHSVKVSASDELLTVKETSKILKVGIHKVYDLIDNGLLIPLKLGSLKIPAIQLDKFISDYTGKDLTNLKNIKDL